MKVRHPVGFARTTPFVAAVGLSGWAALAAVRPFVPGLPEAGLDASWIVVMGEAADRRWRLGIDLAFPYGPASSLVTHYLDRLYVALTLPLLLAVCGVAGIGAVLVSTGPGSRLRIPLLAALVVSFGLVLAGTADFPDAMFLVLPVLPVLAILGAAPGQRRPVVFAAVAATVVGAIGLAKASFPIAALPLFLLGDVATLARRRPPVLTLPFIAGFLAADVAYGQSLSDLPAYVAQQAHTLGGYADAMALDGSKVERLGFVGCVGLLLLVTVLAEWRGPKRSQRSRFVLPVVVAATSATLLKAGFIRQDLHTVVAWSGLALLACLLAWARLRCWRRDVAAAVLVCTATGAAMLIPWTLSRDTPSPGRFGATVALARDRLIRDPEVQLLAALDLARDPDGVATGLADAKGEHWRSIADALPLPRLDGTVDTIPSIQSRVIANGLDYHPRPSFQEYSSYNAALLEANHAFLAGPHAPDWILFGQEPGYGSLTIDRRYPNLAEGALWPDLLRLYRPACSLEGLIALRRQAVPDETPLGEPDRRTVRFDEEVPVSSDGSWFARVSVRPTLLGRLAALLFRPAPVTMTVRFADQHVQDYRLVTGIAEAGFVLSPLVTDAAQFTALADGRAAPPDRVVTAISLHVPSRLQSFFASDTDVSLQRLAVPAAPETSEGPAACGPAP